MHHPLRTDFVSMRDKLHTIIESGVYSIFVTGRRTFSQIWLIIRLIFA
jgi:hypothetical protein